MVATEVALWGSVKSHGFLPDTVIVSDDAGQVQRRPAWRHCPKCQGLARTKWLAERQAELLPVPYFHVVFTLPAPVTAIAFHNKAAVYAILFRAAAETLDRDRRRSAPSWRPHRHYRSAPPGAKLS